YDLRSSCGSRNRRRGSTRLGRNGEALAKWGLRNRAKAWNDKMDPANLIRVAGGLALDLTRNRRTAKEDRGVFIYSKLNVRQVDDLEPGTACLVSSDFNNTFH